MAVRLAAFAAFLLVAGCGPFLLIPGGALEGASASVPADWSFTDEISTVQLETRPEDPYSINIWATGLTGQLYLHAGANRSNWVEHIEANPDVKIRIGEALYDLRASRVEGQDEFSRFADKYEEKYDVRPRNENVDEAYLFRLGAR